MNLKDPDSGKVVAFDGHTLTYTATNSFGARVQDTALCANKDGRWKKVNYDEFMKSLEAESERLKARVEAHCVGKERSGPLCGTESASAPQ